MSASMKISGFKELDALLQSMPGRLVGPGVDAGLRKALQPVAAAARSMAPGSLGGRIKIAPKIKASQMAKSLVKPGKGRRVMYVGLTAPHAHLDEFGTAPRYQKTKGNKYVGIMPPKPFLRPAWDAHKDKVLATLAEAVREEITKALGRRVEKATFIGPIKPKLPRKRK
jgi:HK97 gp10 family phage protein